MVHFSTGAGTRLGRFLATVVANVHLARRLGVVASVLDRRRVAVVRVDANQLASVTRLDTVNENVTLALARALQPKSATASNLQN